MKIFISHSSEDRWVAQQISSLLENDGHVTFLDAKDIKTGESIDGIIQTHLKDSDHLLLLISPASLKSYWVFVELGGAKALGKHVVPILLHVGSNELPGPVANLLARDINDFDEYLKELNKLQKAMSKTGNTGPSEVKIEAGIQFKRKTTKKNFGNFSINDQVRIAAVEHLTEEDKEKMPKWTASMDKFSGATAKITAFSPSGNVYLDISGDEFRWHPDWLTKSE